MNVRLVVAVAAVFVVGCVHTVGRPIDVSRAAELQPGISTLSDAKEKFGEPMSVTSSSMVPGTCYSWMYVRADSFGGRSESRLVNLCFDKDGKLTGTPQTQQQTVNANVAQ